MVKKGIRSKVLKELDGGHSIKMVQKYKEVKIGRMMTDVMESSSVGLFKGKKLVKGGFKHIADALNFYTALDSK